MTDPSRVEALEHRIAELEQMARLLVVGDDGIPRPLYDLTAACQVYVRLPQLDDVRHRIQPELCALRDFIAKSSGRAPQDVQDEFEAAARHWPAQGPPPPA